MKRTFILRIGLYGFLLVVAVFYGGLIQKFKIFPYFLLDVGYSLMRTKEFTETPTEYTETDVSAIISITQPQDVFERRSALIHFLWGTPGLPTSLPSTVVERFQDTRFEDIRSLGSITKLVITTDSELESVVYHFIPKRPSKKVVLYHLGHGGGFHDSKDQIGQFIENGCAVLALNMPLMGLNNQPIVSLPRVGKLKLTTHDHIKFLSPKNGHPVKYFVEPVVIALNHLDRYFDYDSVSMVGISGGGWTTTLAAAVDTRIGKSFPVAGTYPIYLRSNSRRDWGDYEQTVPELDRTVNYLELYILGGHGKYRKQLQILNKYDPCCFAGTKSDTYKDIVRSRMRQLGAGEWDLFLDDAHREHVISNVAMNRILDEIGN